MHRSGPFAELVPLIEQAAPYWEWVLDERRDLQDFLVAAEDCGDVEGVRMALEAIVAAARFISAVGLSISAV